jgi:putative SOS response-associated peptidase YedK
MCGRFILLTDLSVIVEEFGIEDIACECRPNHNISPGQDVLAVARDRGKNRLQSYRWGLVPFWAKDPKIGNKMFNARAETLSEKPSFARAFQKRRCLIPADGFYEWQKVGQTKRPLRFFLKSGRPFCFAGLYETWMSPQKEPLHTCTIVTTQSNDLIRPIHDRMPVILPKEGEALWIDAENRNPQELLSLLKPYPSENMQIAEVDGRMLRQAVV